jgi:hypothetical protein
MTGTPPVTISTLADPVAETREWNYWEEVEDMANLTTFARSDSPLTPIRLGLDQRVTQLIQGDYEDGPEDLMGNLQAALRAGDRRIADQLASLVGSPQHSPEARSLALETLSAARQRSFEPLAAEAVRIALEAPNSKLQFAGIAAVSDLSRRNQILFSRVVRELIQSPNASAAVKRAGAAFLRRRV